MSQFRRWPDQSFRRLQRCLTGQVAFKGAIARALGEKVWPQIEAGKIKPVVFKTFSLAAAADAHRQLESGEHIGKIVLTVDTAS